MTSPRPLTSRRNTCDISALNSSSLKLVDKFTYLGSNVSSTETDINTWLSQIWPIKCSFFQAAVMLMLLYGCTTWMLTKCMEKKLEYTRMLGAILNKPWRQHPTKQQLYGQLPPIMKTIQVRQTRHVEHCWRCGDEFISNILLWTPSHERTKAVRSARIYIQQLWADRGCSLEDLPRVIDDRDGWWERVRKIRAGGVTWW